MVERRVVRERERKREREAMMGRTQKAKRI